MHSPIFFNKNTAIPVLIFSFLLFCSKESIAGENVDKITNNKIVNFDTSLLASLGYSKEIADFFKDSNKYLPGKHDVTIKINNTYIYQTTININENGDLCMDNILIDTLKLKQKEILKTCSAISDIYPNAKINYIPNKSEIYLIFNENDIDLSKSDTRYSKGGFALLANYNIYGMYFKNINSQNFHQGQLDIGANFYNWILRNNGSFIIGENESKYKFNETTLSHSIDSMDSVFQIGQINTNGNIFNGLPLSGIQIYPDSSLHNNVLTIPVVGFTESAATIEVSQNGRLLYQTLVPAGPFELSNINNISATTPLNVVVIQEDGQKQRFSVLTSNINKDTSAVKSNFQLAVGKYRKINSSENSDTPIIIDIERNTEFNYTDYTLGTILSKDYQSIGGKVDVQINNDKSLGVGVLTQNDKYSSGTQLDFNFNKTMYNVSVGVSTLYRTKNYKTLHETLDNKYYDIDEELLENNNNWNHYKKIKSSTSLSSGMSFDDIGRFGYSINYNNYYNDNKNDVSQIMSYSKKIGNITTSINYQMHTDRDNRLYLNLSFPLGKNSSVNIQSQQYHDTSDTTATFRNKYSDSLSYSVGGSNSNNNNKVNGGISLSTPYNKLSVTGSVNNYNKSMMYSTSGAIAYVDNLLVTSPLALGDTFGVIHIPGQSGVKVNVSGGGITTTNYFGIAAIPRLPGRQKTTVQLNTLNLPLNTRLNTTSFDLSVEKGTVVSKTIPSIITNQLLLTVKQKNGLNISSGGSVLNIEGKLVTIVMNNGNVMLTNEQIGQKLILRSPNQDDCTINYSVPEYFDPNVIYEESSAICN